MGDVFVARELASGVEVALKLLSDRSHAAAERFALEGRIAARLHHPHIVRVAAWGHDNGVQHIAMELLEGTDLERRLAVSRMSADEAIAVALQVCDALEHAHEQRVVHRDLKPANIFVCKGTTLHIKVLDFGVARVMDEKRLTRPGSVLGTVAYMSPEQARGERDLDARADIWSLGVVLFECLAGRLPFLAATVPGLLYQILTMPVPDLGELRPDLPRSLVQVVARALSKPRDERFPSARALRNALVAVGPIVDVAHATTVSSMPASAPTEEASAESRLTSVAYLQRVTNPALVADLARDLSGRVVPLQGTALLVLFGADRWFGDEPLRATRFAASAALVAGRIAVATGRAVRSAGDVSGQAVDAAVATATEDGVFLDAVTAAAVRNDVGLVLLPDGRACLVPRATRSTLGNPVDVVFQTPFLGRDIDLSILLQSVDAATSGRTVGVVVCGTEGIGKSRLRHEAIGELQRRDRTVTCLLARCEAFRRDTPFAALSNALTSVTDPTLARVFAAPARQADAQAALDHARTVFHTILHHLATDGTIVLAIDDAQWLDPSSQALLSGLRDLPNDLPLAVWLFTRPETRDTLMALVPRATVRELMPLPRLEAEKLLRVVAGTAPEVVIERAGGHPLFLEQLGRLYVDRSKRTPEHRDGTAVPTDEDLPMSVEGAILAQIDRLHQSEREYAKRAAVFGNVAWAEGVATLGGESGALPGLRREEVLAPRPRGRFAGCTEVAFRSHLVRDVAYGLWPPLNKARMHALAASWLASQAEASPDELALHWDAAGDAAQAARAHADAARHAADVGDVRSARAHTVRVLALTNDPALRWRALAARDDVLQLTPDRELQLEGLIELEALATGLTPQHQAEAAWRRCFAARIASNPALAEQYGTTAVDIALSSGVPRIGAAAHIELALLWANQGRHDDARRHAASARALADRVGDEWLQARTHATVGYTMAEAGDSAEALDWYAMAAAGFRRTGDLRRAAVIHGNAGLVHVGLGRLAEAEIELLTAIDAAGQVGNRATAAFATHNLGLVRRLEGDLAAADELQSKVAEEATRLKHLRLASAVSTERIYVALAGRRDPNVLRARVEGVVEAAVATREQALIAAARAVTARVAVRIGVPEVRALTDLRSQAEIARPSIGRVELLAAIYEAGGQLTGDGEALQQALDEAVSPVSDDDRAACRDVLCRRFLVPSVD